MKLRRKFMELMNQRAQHIQAAEAALEANNQDTYNAEMQAAVAMNSEIQQLQNLIAEQDRFAPHPQGGNHVDPDMSDFAQQLQNGGTAVIPVADVRRAFRQPENAITLATGTLASPTQAGSDVREGFERFISSVIDQVSVVDLTGTSGIEEPYVVEDMEADSGTVESKAGTARTDSDPVFAKAEIRPYEVSVTTYVDRNLSSLTPANYAERIRGMALRALRRKVAQLISNGDGAVSPKFFGFKTAKNMDGEAIYKEIELSDIDENTLTDIVFSYGGDEIVAGGARLYLSKKDLHAFGSLRRTDKERLYDITQDPGNPNCGTIKDGGLIVNYTINSSMASLSDSANAGKQTMCYGNPANYELGLFGGYSIRVDESCKADKRLNTILGDVMAGGNLVVHHGMVVVKRKAS